jgi:CheY-like chemotaxis protein
MLIKKEPEIMTKRILLVDDVEFILEFEEKVIQSVKKEVDFSIIIDKAGNIGDAIRLIDAHDYDLIITDMNLPDGTGTEISKNVIEKDKKSRIAALTIYPNRYENERAYFDAFLKKPIMPSVFKENFRLLLND